LASVLHYEATQVCASWTLVGRQQGVIGTARLVGDVVRLDNGNRIEAIGGIAVLATGSEATEFAATTQQRVQIGGNCPHGNDEGNRPNGLQFVEAKMHVHSWCSRWGVIGPTEILWCKRRILSDIYKSN